MNLDHAATVFVARTSGEPASSRPAGGTACMYTAASPLHPERNEDAAAVIPIDAGRAILAVADGCGGMAAGERAAALAVQTLVDAAAEAGPGDLRPVIMSSLERANEHILALGIGAATTIAVVELSDGQARPYHVGDSEILVVGQRGKVKLCIVTHSPVGYAVEAGLMGADEAMHHEDRHVVSNTLGCPDMRIEVGPSRRLAPRDTVLLASDGLFDNLHHAELVDLIRKGPLDKVAAGLAAAASTRMARPDSDAPCKPDDLTFVLYRASSGRRNAKGASRPATS